MYQYEAIVLKIIDGDTIDISIDLGFNVWLRDLRVRLYGIDTPETRTKDLTEKAEGFRAKERVSLLLPPGTTCVVDTLLDKQDKYGRILGTFWSPFHPDESVNALLVREGLAKPFMVEG